jgi:hypothetical protein
MIVHGLPNHLLTSFLSAAYSVPALSLPESFFSRFVFIMQSSSENTAF